MKERKRETITTSMDSRVAAVLRRWCKKHGYRISDALSLGVSSLPESPPPLPPERRGRPRKDPQ